MTESERPNRTGRITSDFFICFSSRSSSSSMKISSKSILSPGRTDKFREPTLSLSSSLSRRLRNNGSMKGGQSSPMFPTGSKKKGCAFETPEPSSPKVTCIGQVRVKTKKKQGMKKLRTRSKRRGEVSFRKTEQTPEGIVRQRHRNQRWVHLPLTICEALRGLGAEFNCFLPCSGRSGCSWASERKVEKRTTSTSSCGAVFAKWLWALEEGEEKRREMKLEDGEEKREIREKVVSEIEIDISEEKEEIEEEEERRVSICVPPRNALLLMRCRSEPLRMSAYANRFWESEVSKDEEEENVEEQREEEDEEDAKVKLETEEEEKMLEKWIFGETIEEVENLQKEENPETGEEEMLEKWVLAEITKVENPQKEENPEEQKDQEIPDNAEQQEHIEEKDEEEEEIMVSGFSSAALEEEKDSLETEETKEEEEEEKSRESFSCSTEHVQAEEAHESEPGPETAGLEGVVKSTEEKETEEEERETPERSVDEEEEEEERKSKGGEEVLLPDCLLMMMYEPKLSMEVSKETWVCSTDFIRRPRHSHHPEKQQVIQMDGGDKSKKRLSVDSNPAQVHPAAHQQEQQPQQQQHQHQHQLPPRFSCSKLELTVDPSMATMIEHKLVNAVAYEPLVLTRCKSEPMRSSAKQDPEASCFWKNRKMEPCWNRLLSSQAEPI